MKINILLLTLFTLFCAFGNRWDSLNSERIESGIAINSSCGNGLDGKIYQCLPNSKVPKHLFTLIFNCIGSNLTGDIIGPAPEGEHGLFFFHAKLRNLKTDKSGNIEFEFEQGNLYTQQITSANFKNLNSDNSLGASASTLKYKGKIVSNTLVLNCSSEFGDCYTQRMVFKSKK